MHIYVCMCIYIYIYIYIYFKDFFLMWTIFFKSLCWICYNVASVVLLLLLFSRSVMADSLGPQGLQHARLPCPSSTPGVCSNSCPLSQWCCSTICSSVAPFSSCPQSFPASVFSNESSGGQNIGASASASVLPMNIQGCLHSVFFGQEAYRILAPWSVIEPANPALEG